MTGSYTLTELGVLDRFANLAMKRLPRRQVVAVVEDLVPLRLECELQSLGDIPPHRGVRQEDLHAGLR